MIIQVKSSWYCPFWREENGKYKCNISTSGKEICIYTSDISSAPNCSLNKANLVVFKSEENKGRL